MPLCCKNEVSIIKIKKVKNTGKPKWPKKVIMDTGLKVKIPQQNRWNSFNRSHGCSIAAVAIAMQLLGIRKNPDDIYNWCKKNIYGYTGSKLTIYGTMLAINGIAGKKKAEWHPIEGTKKSKKAAKENIRKAVRQGAMVMVEQANPIHTNIIIARRTGGVWIATNGVTKKTTIKRMVREALKGCAGAKNQVNWYVSGKKEKAAGYVIVWPK